MLDLILYNPNLDSMVVENRGVFNELLLFFKASNKQQAEFNRMFPMVVKSPMEDAKAKPAPLVYVQPLNSISLPLVPKLPSALSSPSDALLTDISLSPRVDAKLHDGFSKVHAKAFKNIKSDIKNGENYFPRRGNDFHSHPVFFPRNSNGMYRLRLNLGKLIGKDQLEEIVQDSSLDPENKLFLVYKLLCTLDDVSEKIPALCVASRDRNYLGHWKKLLNWILIDPNLAGMVKKNYEAFKDTLQQLEGDLSFFHKKFGDSVPPPPVSDRKKVLCQRMPLGLLPIPLQPQPAGSYEGIKSIVEDIVYTEKSVMNTPSVLPVSFFKQGILAVITPPVQPDVSKLAQKPADNLEELSCDLHS